MKKIFVLVTVLLAANWQNASAQYFQFIENKGQWDSSIKFKTDFKGGALFLKPDGYSVVLRNMQQLRAIAEYFGGHKDSAVKINSPKGRQNFVLHSHAYEMHFLNADPNAVAEPDKPLNIFTPKFADRIEVDILTTN